MVKLTFSIAATVAMMASVANASGCNLRFNQAFWLISREHRNLLSTWRGTFANTPVMNGAGDGSLFEPIVFCVVTDFASSCLSYSPPGCIPRSDTYYIKAEENRGSAGGYLSYNVTADNVVYINPSTSATKFFVFDDPGGLRLRAVDSNVMITSVLNPTDPTSPNKVTLEPATNSLAQTFEIST
ncbi:MAG: hypothetical protein J3Q66DRAFT_340574 [Benniella sp.]|nr:MAG: hypothetical protein J3Q66DRAFT_340574 [Benniella sp.]